jgi:hypothetical protein
MQLSGSIGGTVRDTSGVAQMGATIFLYNRYDRIIRQVTTPANGTFLFDSLLPDLYSIRVTLSSFIPAFRRNIAVQPGFHSVLTINMASMLSSIEFVSAIPSKGTLMSDEWKWALRSSQSTRPVLRFSDLGLESPKNRGRQASVFSETRGIVKVSAGDGTSFAGPSAQPDLGTAFAVATSVLGSNQLELSGNFGYSSHTGLPTAGFRTRFSRSAAAGSTPELTIGMHQIYLPTRGGFGPSAGQDGAPALRSLSVSTIDELAITDRLRMEYGMSAESVSLTNRLNLLSPFARLSYDLGSLGVVRLAYSSGAAATELASRLDESTREDAALSRDFAALASLPRVSMRAGRAEVQRTENIELGYTKVSRGRTYSAGIYHERVRNGAVTLAGAGDLFMDDILPDLGTDSSVFNVGRYNRWGYLASVSQNVTDRLEVTIAYGRGGALTNERGVLTTGSADDLRGMISVKERNWASARVSGTAPITGTRISASYGWSDHHSLMPGHLYLAQRFSPEPGLNIAIRQPLPSMGLVPGRFEATAELRNLMEQGYLPIGTGDGRTMLLTNAPKAVRGGLSFIF